MKSFIFHLFVFFMLAIVISFTSCKKDETPDPFNDEARQKYEVIMNLQEEGASQYNNFMQVMDSADAVGATAEWFRNQSMVQSANVSSQGISVVYTNGIWGGLELDGKRYDMDMGGSSHREKEPVNSSTGDLKNTPSNPIAIFMPASYSEFLEANQYQGSHWSADFDKVGYGYAMNGVVTLNYLADVRELGSVLCFDSHGYAWPDDKTVTEVYFKTAEVASVASTQKYYQDILDKDILILKSVKTGETKYYIAPDFIKKYNDFSKDTVLFYGGFCYSFLGTWPSLAEVCASGTYFGFDWIVRADKCTYWAVDIVEKMTDKNAPEPWTVEDWMSKSAIEKKYFDDSENKMVNILYEGNGALTFWKPSYSADGIIEAINQDGAPVLIPGYICQEYGLRCKVNGELPVQVYYFWDIEDGHGGNYGQNGNEMTCLYINPGTYTVRVEVRNQANDEVIKEITGQVHFIDPSFLPNLKSLPYLEGSFLSDAVHLSDGTVPFTAAFYFYTGVPFTIPLTWTDSSFFAQQLSASGSSYLLKELSGEVTADGKVIKHLYYSYIEKHNDNLDFEVILELANVPIFHRDEWNCFYGFAWDFYGTETQPYVIDIVYRDYNYQTQQWITIHSIDWANSRLYGYFEN